MTRIGHTYDDETVYFKAEGAAPSVVDRLFGRKTGAGNVDGWAAGDAARCDAFGALRMHVEDHPGAVRFEGDRIVAAHAAVASLSAGQAHAIGLPARLPFVLSTDTNGVIGSSNFRLITHWLDAGRRVAAHRRGAFLKTGKDMFLIPEQLYSAVELADGFDAGTVKLPDHWAALARFRSLLGRNTYLIVDDDLEPALQLVRENSRPALKSAGPSPPTRVRQSSNGWPRRHGRRSGRRPIVTSTTGCS